MENCLFADKFFFPYVLSQMLHSFLLENFRLVLLIKKLLMTFYKDLRVNSKLNTGWSNFLAKTLWDLFCDFMGKITLIRISHAQTQIAKLVIASWKSCHYVELEPVESQNTKTSTAVSKKGKHLEKEKFLVNLCELMAIFFLSRIEIIVIKTFLKKINQYQ